MKIPFITSNGTTIHRFEEVQRGYYFPTEDSLEWECCTIIWREFNTCWIRFYRAPKNIWGSNIEQDEIATLGKNVFLTEKEANTEKQNRLTKYMVERMKKLEILVKTSYQALKDLQEQEVSK